MAGLWLAGEVVNHVGIYGSKAAEGLSAFQRRSCYCIALFILFISCFRHNWNDEWAFETDKTFKHDIAVSIGKFLTTCLPPRIREFMMTSSDGNIFRVTGHLCGEFTGPGEFPAQRPVTRSFDVFFDLGLNKRLSKQSWGWWSETPSWSWWRHCNVLKLSNLSFAISLLVYSHTLCCGLLSMQWLNSYCEHPRLFWTN